jgi:hypothetical protein
MNSCGDCACGVNGTEVDVASGCELPPYSIHVKEDGRVFYNSGDSTFTGIKFNIDSTTVIGSSGGDVVSIPWLMISNTTIDFMSYGNGNQLLYWKS